VERLEVVVRARRDRAILAVQGVSEDLIPNQALLHSEEPARAARDSMWMNRRA